MSPLKDVHTLILQTHEYVTLYDKIDFFDMMEDYPGISVRHTLILC